MRGQPRGSRGTREHHPKDVRALVVVDERTEAQQLGASARCEPAAHVGTGAPGPAVTRLEARERVAQLAFEHERVVLLRLDAHEQAVEGRDVDSDRVVSALECLHERRPRPRERIEHTPPGPHEAAQQLLDELRHVLAEVRVEAVHVLGAQPLRQLALRPRQARVVLEALVERFLGRTHSRWDSTPPRPLPRPCSERVGHVLDPPAALGDHVEADVQPGEAWMGGEPELGGAADAASLLRRHHLERIAELVALLRLHLAEHERPAAPCDQIELVAAEPAVRVQDAVAVQPVPAGRTTLGRMPNRPRGARALPR